MYSPGRSRLITETGRVTRSYRAIGGEADIGGVICVVKKADSDNREADIGGVIDTERRSASRPAADGAGVRKHEAVSGGDLDPDVEVNMEVGGTLRSLGSVATLIIGFPTGIGSLTTSFSSSPSIPLLNLMTISPALTSSFKQEKEQRRTKRPTRHRYPPGPASLFPHKPHLAIPSLRPSWSSLHSSWHRVPKEHNASTWHVP